MSETVNENLNTNNNSKDKRNRLIIIALLILLLGAGIVIGVLLNDRKGSGEPAPEKNADGVVGVISDSWDFDVPQPEPDQKRPGTQIPGYSSARMKEGDTSLRLRIGNPKDNKVGFIASLRLEDGTELYRSPMLRPGQGLDEIPLSSSLKAGEYKALVEYQCVSLTDETAKMNAAQSGFTLIVE